MPNLRDELNKAIETGPKAENARDTLDLIERLERDGNATGDQLKAVIGAHEAVLDFQGAAKWKLKLARLTSGGAAVTTRRRE